MPLTNHQVGLLREAIDDAEAWRGGTNPDLWDEFDAHIAKMREALEQVKRDRKELRKLWNAQNPRP